MAQSIAINKIDEDGRIIQATGFNFAPVINSISNNYDSKSNFPWLSTIDEYGNTHVNHLQKKYLISELNDLLKSSSSESINSTIQETIKVLDDLSFHEYLVFVGD